MNSSTRRRGSDSSIDFSRRIDDWSYVPNSYVNDDGDANLDNDNADNRNDGRLSVRKKG